jgi:DNA-binding response OmpR family regulator
MNILIIEDNSSIVTNLTDYLEHQGHSVDIASDGVTGLHLAVTHKFDAVLLDLSLPGMDGLSLCRRLREDAKNDVPILMLTARDTLADKLKGFEFGADDYLVKPFALKEVEARLNALVKRRKGNVASQTLQIGNLCFDPVTYTVSYCGKEIKLPPKCVRILELMMTNPGKTFTRTDLENPIWGSKQPNSDTLRSHMHILRRALTASGLADSIETVHGVGYKITVPNASPATQR